MNIAHLYVSKNLKTTKFQENRKFTSQDCMHNNILIIKWLNIIVS